MPGWIEDLRSYFSDGRCRNNTAGPVHACSGNQLISLNPGEELPATSACRGLISPDGSVIGMAGWRARWVGVDGNEFPRLIRVANDGEVFATRSPLHYRIRPEALRVLVPGQT